MTKTIALIASVAAVIAFGVAWGFDKIDGESFATITTAVVAAIWGIYNKYENIELKSQLTLVKMENEGFVSAHNQMAEDFQKVRRLNSSMVEALKAANNKVEELHTKKEPTPVIIEPVITSHQIEDEIAVTPPVEGKTKRSRRKK